LRTGFILKRKLKRNPTATEIAEEYNRVHRTSVRPDTVLKAIEQRSYANRMTSEITTEVRTGDAIEHSGGPTVSDALDLAIDEKPLVDAVLEAKEREAVLAKLMMTGLQKRERLILGDYVGVHAEVEDGVYRLRESDGGTLDSVAANQSVTRERIRQIVLRAERKIKMQIATDPDLAELFRDSRYFRSRGVSLDAVHPEDRPLIFLGN
jgi:DNA-directed RNA polymerase sigma subunit (sigma70/sigma32)